MALFDNMQIKDGLVMGGPEDLCYKCEAKRMIEDRDSDIPYGKLEYQPVFRIRLNGNDTVLCMEHFKEMVNQSDRYKLVDLQESTVVPNSLLQEAEEQPAPKEEPKKEVKAKKTSNKKKEDK